MSRQCLTIMLAEEQFVFQKNVGWIGTIRGRTLAFMQSSEKEWDKSIL